MGWKTTLTRKPVWGLASVQVRRALEQERLIDAIKVPKLEGPNIFQKRKCKATWRIVGSSFKKNLQKTVCWRHVVFFVHFLQYGVRCQVGKMCGAGRGGHFKRCQLWFSKKVVHVKPLPYLALIRLVLLINLLTWVSSIQGVCSSPVLWVLQWLYIDNL